MFEKESNLQDITTINLDNYQQQKKQPQKCSHPFSPIVIFIIAGFIFIALAVASLISNFQSDRVELPLRNNNGSLVLPAPTYLSFANSQQVGLYLRIQKLTQYTRRGQLFPPANGDLVHSQGQCDSYRTNGQLGKTVSVSGGVLVGSDFATPCGYYAGMFPISSIGVTLGNGSALLVDSGNLTNFVYGDQNINLNMQWVDLNSGRFQSWMEANAELTTFKLIGRIGTSFEGLVDISIVLPEGLPGSIGEVSISLESVEGFGHRNLTLSVACFVQGVVLFLFALANCVYGRVIDHELEESKKPEGNGKNREKGKTGHMLELHSSSEREQVAMKSP